MIAAADRQLQVPRGERDALRGRDRGVLLVVDVFRGRREVEAEEESANQNEQKKDVPACRGAEPRGGRPRRQAFDQREAHEDDPDDEAEDAKAAQVDGYPRTGGGIRQPRRRGTYAKLRPIDVLRVFNKGVANESGDVTGGWIHEGVAPGLPLKQLALRQVVPPFQPLPRLAVDGRCPPDADKHRPRSERKPQGAVRCRRDLPEQKAGDDPPVRCHAVRGMPSRHRRASPRAAATYGLMMGMAASGGSRFRVAIRSPRAAAASGVV